MARPQEHLADALEALKAIQDKGVVAMRSKDLGKYPAMYRRIHSLYIAG